MNHSDMAAPKTPTLLEGYGTGGFSITTHNSKAQAFFNNGMQLAHAFAHQAAIEAMGEAVRLDPPDPAQVRDLLRLFGGSLGDFHHQVVPQDRPGRAVPL